MSTFSEHFSEQEWQLLLDRAKRAQHALKTQTNDQRLAVLLVQIEQTICALPITAIRGIYEQVSVVQLPHTPPHIYGIANIRGTLATVLLLQQILQIPAALPQDPATLILLAHQTAYSAFYVPQVLEVTTIDLNQVQAFNSTHHAYHYTQGMLPDGVLLLNVGKILQDPVFIVHQSL
jgi:chemotaxis signal transduction protein